MEITLNDGTKLRCDDRPFSSGAEGEVYFSEGKTHVIKLYFPDPKTGKPDPHRRTTIDNILTRFNLVKDDPSRAAYFGWPDSIVTSPNLGIRMPMVKDTKPLETYVRPKFWKSLPASERGSWQTRLSIAFRMARIMRWMHMRGLCHSDLSLKNFLVNIKTGQTTLIDCDGLVVPGIQPPSVFGTHMFMAPEIEAGKAMPSVNTDKHALAVLIYETLLLRHPLEGPKTYSQDAEKDEQMAYGDRALYIENPKDQSNRPAKLPFTSDMFTPLVKGLFNKAFIDGLHNPVKRPSAAEWESALQRMADRIIPCQNPSCDMKAFIVPDTPQFKCPWCGTPYRSPGGVIPIALLYRPGNVKGSFVSDNWSIAAYQNRPIFLYHADSQNSLDHNAPPTPIAHFEADGKGKWYLKNDGIEDLRVFDGSISSPVKRGSSIEISSEMKIMLGQSEKSRFVYVQMLKTS